MLVSRMLEFAERDSSLTLWTLVTDNGSDISGARSLAEMQLAHDPMHWFVHTDCMKHQYHLMSRRHRFERKQLIG